VIWLLAAIALWLAVSLAIIIEEERDD